MAAPPIPLLHLFLAERDRVVGLIGRIVRCRETAEDLAHEALLRLWHRPIVDKDRSLLFRTAQNLAIDHLRSQQVRAEYARASVAAGSEDTPPAADASEPQSEVAVTQQFNGLVAALHSLPERTQRIFLLNRIDDLSYAQIARHLGISVSTVEKEMMRALEVCRQCLDDTQELR